MPAPQLTQLLSQLRAPIFNTLPVVSNARNGAKYLKRRLRGPSIINYAPQLSMPSIKFITSNKAMNPYAGWEGNGLNSSYMLPKDKLVPEGCVEIERSVKPGHNARDPNAARAPWLVNPREEERFADVARKRKLGKGPPKKGEWESGGVAVEKGRLGKETRQDMGEPMAIPPPPSCALACLVLLQHHSKNDT
jgi:hypothetical protein